MDLTVLSRKVLEEFSRKRLCRNAVRKCQLSGFASAVFVHKDRASFPNPSPARNNFWFKPVTRAQFHETPVTRLCRRHINEKPTSQPCGFCGVSAAGITYVIGVFENLGPRAKHVPDRASVGIKSSRDRIYIPSPSLRILGCCYSRLDTGNCLVDVRWDGGSSKGNVSSHPPSRSLRLASKGNRPNLRVASLHSGKGRMVPLLPLLVDPAFLAHVLITHLPQ